MKPKQTFWRRVERVLQAALRPSARIGENHPAYLPPTNYVYTDMEVEVGIKTLEQYANHKS